MNTAVVVIPTLNEARAIGKVIEQVPLDELLDAGLETTVCIIDGHSTDNTINIARGKGAEIILEEAKGKGTAIRTAFQEVEADDVIMVDGDDTYPTDVATEMVRLVQTHDVVVGSHSKAR